KRYQNVSVDGKLERSVFDGVLAIRDAHLKANYLGTFDFSGSQFKMNFNSEVRHINLDYMGVTKNLNAKLKANINGDFTFTNLDDFIGKLNIENLHFTSKTDTLN